MIRLSQLVWLVAGLLVLLVPPKSAFAQAEISARTATITVGGRLHTQLSSTTVDGAGPTNIFLRRARLYLGIEVNDFLEAVLQPDFVGGKARLQDAYVRFNLSDGFAVTVGQMKRAFDLFELSSSTRLSVIERDGRIPGVDRCAGVGGICSWSGFNEELAYSERDVGVRFEGDLSESVSYMVAVTNGTGVNVPDENSSKSYSARLRVELGGGLRVAANTSIHDYIGPRADTDYGVALGGDIEFGSWQDGLHLQAGFVTGDNWLSLDGAGDPATFRTFQVIGSYYIPLDDGERFVGIEPVGRISWGDPDSDASDDGGVLLTPGIMFYVIGRSKVGANLDIYSPNTGDTEMSLKLQTYLYF
jgi:Phosphate-selective porin O and P